MKKKFLNILRAASLMLVACAIAVACSDDKSDDGGGKKPDPDPDPNEEGAKVTESIRTPLTYYVRSYDPGADGVKIHVNTTVENNIIFTCTPGERVKSYRLNVYPLIGVYDMLLDQIPDGVDKLSVSESEKYLFQMLLNGNAPTSLFTSDKSLNNAENNIVFPENYAETEFDWGNTSYSKFALLPDAEYLIVAEAYTDAAGDQDASRSLVYATTTFKELLGDPRVEVNLTESYTSYTAVHMPNTDAAGINFFGAPTAGIQKFLDAFGEKRFINYVRYIQGGSIDATDSDNLTFKQGDINTGEAFTHTVFAVDENGTPNPDSFIRRDFTTKVIPEDIPVPEFSLTWDETKTNSSLAYFNLKMEKNCKTIAFQVVGKAEAEKLQNGGEDAKINKIELISRSGWATPNKNFTWDEYGYPTGKSYDTKDFAIDYTISDIKTENLKPETEYVCMYIGLDAFGRAANKLEFLHFKTKKRVMDTPEACKADVNFTVKEKSRTVITMGISYNIENTACYHWQCIVPGPPDPKKISQYFPNLPSFVTEFCSKETTNRQEWEYWFYEAIQNGVGGPVQWSQCWYGTDEAGVAQAGCAGLDPSTDYVYAYMAEDYNGVCGPVKFVEATTMDNIGGPNPTVEIAGKFITDDKSKCGFIYQANEDMTSFRYMLGKNSAFLLNRLENPNYTYEDIITAWTTQLLANGMVFRGFRQTQEALTTEPVVALALPYGKDNVEGKLEHMICINGEFKLLDDFKTPATPKQVGKRARTLQNMPNSNWNKQQVSVPARLGCPVSELEFMKPRQN